MNEITNIENEEGEYLLEEAVNDVYEAVIQDEDELEDNEIVDEDVLWFREELQKHKNLNWLYRPSVVLVSVALFFFSIASAIGSPASQVVVYQLSCNSVAKDGICDPVAAQLLLSTFNQFQLVVSGILPIVVSGKFGELSDRYGRTPFIGMIFTSVCVHKVINYILFTKSTTLPFRALLIVDFLCSAFGGIPPLIAMIQSYVTDVVDIHERSFSIGLVNAAILTGSALGPIVSNLIVSFIPIEDGKHVGLPVASIQSKLVDTFADIPKRQLVPLRIEMVLIVLMTTYVLFLLPESRGEKARSKSRANSMASDVNALQQLRTLEAPTFWTKFNRYFNIFKPLYLLTYPSDIVPAHQRQNIKRNRFVVLLIIVSTVLINSAAGAMGQISIQYGLLRFNWDSTNIGYFLTVYSSSSAMVLIFIAPIISKTILPKVFKLRVMKHQIDLIDVSLMVGGRIFDVIAYISLALVTTSNQFYASFAVLALAAPAGPAASAALLKFFPVSKTGEFFGAISLLSSLLGLITPILMLSLYKYFIGAGTPQYTYLAFALPNIIYIVVILLVKRIMNLTTRTREQDLIRRSSSVSFGSLRDD
ncbi:multidrug efflux protein [Scheffersomyces amazonensis]|uniref:multidrug efflux protein n=1 Tax=Scheffersomyces amazonensis TaxID=1078765 RepID=UPI00315C9AD9